MNLFEMISLSEDEPGHFYNQFVARFLDRDRFQSFLAERGVETEIYYPLPLHVQECFRNLGYVEAIFVIRRPQLVNP